MRAPSRRSTFGVTLARSIPPERYALRNYLFRTAATVGDAMRVAARFTTMDGEALETAVVEADDEVVFEISLPGDPSCVGPEANECGSR